MGEIDRHFFFSPTDCSRSVYPFESQYQKIKSRWEPLPTKKEKNLMHLGRNSGEKIPNILLVTLACFGRSPLSGKTTIVSSLLSRFSLKISRADSQRFARRTFWTARNRRNIGSTSMPSPAREPTQQGGWRLWCFPCRSDRCSFIHTNLFTWFSEKKRMSGSMDDKWWS